MVKIKSVRNKKRIEAESDEDEAKSEEAKWYAPWEIKEY